jgi:hypothetical protein
VVVDFLTLASLVRHYFFGSPCGILLGRKCRTCATRVMVLCGRVHLHGMIPSKSRPGVEPATSRILSCLINRSWTVGCCPLHTWWELEREGEREWRCARPMQDLYFSRRLKLFKARSRLIHRSHIPSYFLEERGIQQYDAGGVAIC